MLALGSAPIGKASDKPALIDKFIYSVKAVVRREPASVGWWLAPWR